MLIVCLAKKIFFLELTIALMENMQAPHHQKLAKYEEQVQNLKSKNFDVKLESIEVRSRGMLSIVPFSIIDDFALVIDWEVERLLESVHNKAIVCSYAMWTRRNSSCWN